MSIAPREAKWISPCTIWAGHERFGQRTCTSPGGCTTGVEQAGHSAGIEKGRSFAGPLLGERRHDLRYHVARPLDDDAVADPQVLAGDVVLVVERRELDGGAADHDRLELREGHQRPGAADVDLDRVERRGGRGRRELVGDRPPRRPAHRAQPRLHVGLVDLHDGAVDVEVDRRAPRLPGLALGLDLVEVVGDADVGVDPEARLAQPLEGRRLGRQLEPLGVPDGVAPYRQRPLGGRGGVELAQAAGGRVARVGEGGQPRGRARGVQLGERRQRQVHLAAHLDDGRRRHPLRRPQALRDRPDGAQVGGDVLADDAVAARRPLHEAAVLVGQGDREAVDLGLDDEGHLARCQALLLHHRAGAPVPGGELVGAAGVRQAQHRPAVADLGEAPRRRRAHALRGRVGRAQRGVRRLQGLQLAHPVVVRRVVDRRRVEDVVGVVRLVDQAAQLRRAGRVVAHLSARPGTPAPARPACRRSCRAPTASSAAREKKPQVTPIVVTPDARPDSMSKGESPT